MRIEEEFSARFDHAPTIVAEAPGRVNLIGEHTDYNGGFVLPIAIPRRTIVGLAPRSDRRVRVCTTDVSLETAGSEEYLLGSERRTGRWIDYVQGCTAELHDTGYVLHGFDAVVSSAVPVGAGLASSAALEVAMLRALRAAFALVLDDVALALLAHRAECELVGARVGVMDQMAASLGDERAALFLDTRTLAWERIPFTAHGALAVIDSGVAHRHVAGGYNARRAECERAAALLDVATLRELGADALERAATLPAPLNRRVRHVVGENARVLAAVEALRGGELTRVGALLTEGHASLRDDFEVSTREVDLLTTLASNDPDVLGARLTGGGFGGAVVVLARAGAAAAAADRIAGAYGRHVSGGRVLVGAAESLGTDG